MVILLDAINQLDPSYHLLHWLPDALPPNITIIISSTDTKEIAEGMSKKKNVQKLQIMPLGESERRELVIKRIGLYGKSIKQDYLVCIFSTSFN